MDHSSTLAKSELSRPSSASLYYALAVVFVDSLGVGIALPIFPDLIADLCGGNISKTAWFVGVIASSYPLMQFLCAPIIGLLSDKYGRCPILVASMVFLGLDYLVQALSTDVHVLFVGRILAGVAGSSIAAANAMVADISDDETRVKNFGTVGACFGLGLIAGPALGSWLSAISLRTPLLVIVVVAWTLAIVGVKLARRDKLRIHKRVHDAMHSLRVHPVRILKRHPLVFSVALAVLFTSLAQRGLENLFVLYTSVRFDWSRMQSGSTLCLLGIMAVLVQGILAKPIINRVGERNAAVGSTLILVLALAAISFANKGWMLYPILAVGAFSGLAGPALQAIVTKRLDQDEQGQVQGLFVSVVNLSGTIAPFLFTSILFHSSVRSSIQSSWLGWPFAMGSGLVAMGTTILWLTLPMNSLDLKTSESTQ